MSLRLKRILIFFLFSAFVFGEKEFYLNFNNVEIKTFIKFIGEITKENYVIDPNVKGMITIYSKTPIPVDQIDRNFKAILNFYGFTVIKKEGLCLITSITEGKQISKFINIGEVPKDKEDEFINQIITLKYYPSDNISPLITPYLSKGGQITIDTRTNTLIISDIGENIKKIKEIIDNFDKPSPPGQEEIRVFKLQNADAEEIANVLTQVFQRVTPTVRTVTPSTPTPTTPTIRTIPSRTTGTTTPTPTTQAVPTTPTITTFRTPVTTTATLQPYVVPVKATNSIVVYSDPQNFPTIEKIVKELDVLPNQVLIEALIAEVTFDKFKEIGVEWANTWKFDGETYTGIAGTNLGTLYDYIKTGVPPSGLSIGVYKGDFTFPLSVGALINLYAKDTQFKILSTPQLVTTDNQEASINVSENIPYLKETRFYAYGTGQIGDIVKSYDYKDVGIILKIIPQISQDKYVKLKIIQEVTKIIEGGIPEAPTTAKRQADTTLIIPNGKTVVLGGLLRDDAEKSVQKVPFLGDIPLLGHLFRKQTTKTVKTNLMIFITPRIISTFEEAEKIKQEKEKVIKNEKGG
ncbi:MAG: hypothetical protein NC915_02110 [Candidatus Omnitrophica bacterium]|nr:hypothetical protein [Candidatus Omnitrophota bacterium]